jgi:hypothetical protein
MPQDKSNAPDTPQEERAAAYFAGWNPDWGPAPFEHGLPVEALQTQTDPPVRDA